MVREIAEEARRLIDEQRRALRQADFRGLLAAAHGFHQLAERLSTLVPTAVPPEASVEMRELRDQIARQGRLFEAAIAATTPPAQHYAPKQAPPAGASILIDRYA